MSVLSTLNCFPDQIGEDVAKELSTGEQGLLETMLLSRCWYYHRYAESAMQRTQSFVFAYNEVMKLRVATNPFVTDKVRERGGRFFIAPAEIERPWLKRDPAIPGRLKIERFRRNPRWPLWLRARRSADLRGMDYADYINAAYDAALKRGWTHFAPSNLASAKLLGKEDGYVEATIPHIVSEKYAQAIHWDTRFDPAAPLDPVSLAYWQHIARDCARIHGPRAETVFRQYQRDARVPASLLFSSLLS